MAPFLLLGSLAPLFNTVGFVALVIGGLLLFAAFKLLKEPNSPIKFTGGVMLVMELFLVAVALALFGLA